MAVQNAVFIAVIFPLAGVDDIAVFVERRAVTLPFTVLPATGINQVAVCIEQGSLTRFFVVFIFFDEHAVRFGVDGDTCALLLAVDDLAVVN